MKILFRFLSLMVSLGILTGSAAAFNPPLPERKPDEVMQRMLAFEYKLDQLERIVLTNTTGFCDEVNHLFKEGQSDLQYIRGEFEKLDAEATEYEEKLWMAFLTSTLNILETAFSNLAKHQLVARCLEA